MTTSNPKPGNVLALRPEPSADLDAWLAEGRDLAVRDARLTWEIADWWNRGEPYGDRAKEGAALFHYNPSYLRYLGSVAARVQERSNTLPWSHHAAVASLEPAEQKRLLERAERENLSVRELKKAIRGELNSYQRGEWAPGDDHVPDEQEIVRTDARQASIRKSEGSERAKRKAVKELIESIGLEGGWHKNDQWYLIWAPPLWAGCGDPTAFLTSPRAKAVKDMTENAARLSNSEFAALLRKCAYEVDKGET